MIEDDENAIVQTCDNRTPTREIARAYGISTVQVNAITGRLSADVFEGGKHRRFAKRAGTKYQLRHR